MCVDISLTQGKKIKCSTSQAKHRLFLSNIPRSWGEDGLRKIVAEVGPGVTNVQLVKEKSSSNNRGYAFIEYYNNACAEYSRQKMMDPKFKLGDNAPAVSWADPKNADSSASSQVKALYVKNLPKTVTQDQLKKLFERHGKITKVVLPPAKSGQEKNRIGFVHFAERSSAMKALKDTEKYELDGQLVECALAKPQSEQKAAGGSNLQNTGLLPGYPPGVGYGMMGNAYGALGAGYVTAGFAQPLIYGSGPSPAGMAMMPMLLPDGQFGYVLQQPGVQLHSPTSYQRNDSRSGSGRGNKMGGSSSRVIDEESASHHCPTLCVFFPLFYYRSVMELILASLYACIYIDYFITFVLCDGGSFTGPFSPMRNKYKAILSPKVFLGVSFPKEALFHS
ncbi:heterogeneous nuclear ribonucleoprotein Q-like isoform X2 [Populus alba x Populus x berolinensis]|uniref:Heterogeneous nuclear ribonucleoprotein Q-like isoform X2 n=1 Tax=Populus alba x Populus x berolinensis TaxID=444605 RepID=A0AAD6QBN0_9ROSI|nr:heterogeneous nuclear ribonucleoprotein Q-like isoform X2 [Populus alba x Populus x berolinensis]